MGRGSRLPRTKTMVSLQLQLFADSATKQESWDFKVI